MLYFSRLRKDVALTKKVWECIQKMAILKQLPTHCKTKREKGAGTPFPRVPVSSLAGPKFGGSKMFYFRRITLFSLGYRLSMHKMTICFKNFGGHGPVGLP